MTKTRNFWNQLTATLWFIPALLAILGGLLGLLLVAVDYYAGSRGYFPHFLDVQPSGARDMLAVVAGSMITVAGTVFSITIVALTLASTQFSPRILRNFMRDTGNQVVLGAFVGIFAYCIVVLRTIRDSSADGGTSFVPSIAVAFGVVCGLSGIGFLIYFIHHVATGIQATSIISTIADETIAEIEENYAHQYDPKQFDAQILEELSARKWIKIPSAETGYLQNADTNALSDLAKRFDLVVRMRRRVGEFTIKSLPLLQISPRDENFEPDEKLIAEFNKAYDIGNFRTVEGDVAFGLRQIVDIALKALSPAVNDTTTALSSIDYLTAILISLAVRPSRPPLYFCEGELRLVVNEQRFEDYFDLAFNQIRQNASGNVAVILRLLTAMEVLGKANQNFTVEVERAERHELLETQTRLLYGLAERTVGADSDLQTIARHYTHLKETLEGLR
ncbi:MAG TPA: DUF2254 domain-containing protein [Pyrinomonadaceae bacterium]|nr:DUF2254 domain-containing protein [Pyrinomonadaceae bacterium]